MPLARYTAIALCWLGMSTAITFENVEHTFDTLQTWYNSSTGLWMPSAGWWNSANCLTMLANLATIDGTVKDRTKDLWQEVFTKAPTFNAQMTKTIRPHWRRELPSKLYLRDETQEDATNFGFFNDFYDDEGWWALAWVAVYDLTREQKYLDEAVRVFNDMHAAYNTTPVGGMWWNKDKTYVNAITNELHFSIAAHLANRCASQDAQHFITIAQDSWDWFYGSGMINDYNNVKDGVMATDPTGINMPIVWSYNQGVLLAALTELSHATSQTLYITIARTIADAALSNLTAINNVDNPNLVLHDPCEPSCGTDGAQFKGIFARNLAHLHSVAPEDRYAEFLMKNAEALWQNGRDQFNRFGEVWSGPFAEPASASPQCSGMDLLVGALAQLGEWEGNGTYKGGKVLSQGDGGGDGQGWDTISREVGSSSSRSLPVAGMAGRSKRSFFWLW